MSLSKYNEKRNFNDTYKGSAENALKHGLHKGRLSFIMKGKKLKGEFSLVKLKGKQENAWPSGLSWFENR